MSGSPKEEHERVADILHHLNKRDEVAIQHVDTELNFNSFTACTVTFKLSNSNAKE